MTTGGRDPFEDLLDLGDGADSADSPPPLPTTQPPGDDSWMVLSKGEEDFNSVTEDDLFGPSSKTGEKKTRSSKAHGTTFDDLFGAGDKKKKSSTSHGSTFDDLFDDGDGSKDKKTTFDELFPSESDKKSGSNSKMDDPSDDELFGSGVTKKSSKSTTKTLRKSKKEESLDDIFQPSGKSKTLSDANKSSDEDLFKSGRGKTSNSDTSKLSSGEDILKTSAVSEMSEDVKPLDDPLTEMFGSQKSMASASPDITTKQVDLDSVKEPAPNKADTKGRELPLTTEDGERKSMEEDPLEKRKSSKSETSIDQKKSSDDASATTGAASKINTDEFDSLFGSTEKKSRFKKSHGPTYDELFGDESSVKKSGDDIDGLFGSPKSTVKETEEKQSEKSLDDLFGSTPSKATTKADDKVDKSFDELFGPSKTDSLQKKADKSFDELFGSKSSSKDTSAGVSASSSKSETVPPINSDRAGDLDDLFTTGTSKSVTNKESESPPKVDIVVSSESEPAKPRTSSSGDHSEKEDLDFSVIEDTSLLDANITRHKSSLRKRGSLARRKRPTRSSMRRVHQQGSDLLAVSPTVDDDDDDDDEDTKAVVTGQDEAKADVMKQYGAKADVTIGKEDGEEKEEEKTSHPVVKKSPVAGGKLLFGADVLSQSKLLKNISSRREQSEEPKSVSKEDKPLFPRLRPTTKTEPVAKVETVDSTSKSEPSTKTSPMSDVSTKPVIKSSKPQISPRSKPLSQAEVKVETVTPESKKIDTDVSRPKLSSTPQPSPSKIESVTLEKITLRSTRSGSTPPDPKQVTSPPSENNGIHSGLVDRRSSLRRVSPAKVKDVPKEEVKSQPSWLSEMKLRSTKTTEVSKPDSNSVSPLSSVSDSTRSTPQLKPVISAKRDDATIPTLKPVITAKRDSGLAPPLKPVISVKRDVTSAPPLKPIISAKKDACSVPPLKPVISGRGDATDGGNNKPAVTSRRKVDSPRASENKPLLANKPAIDKPKPKPKIEAMKPLSSVNGKGDDSNRSPLGVRETNTSSTDIPPWKRQLQERNKKRKDDPVPSTPPKQCAESGDGVAVNWRSQLSQKKRSQPSPSGSGEMKSGGDSQQPAWAVQAEQRRARLIKSGVIAQK